MIPFLLFASLVAHGLALEDTPVWRSATETAKSWAMLAFLSHVVALVCSLAPVWRRRRWLRWKPPEVHRLDRDGPRSWLTLLAATPLALGGCAADSNRVVTAHGVIELGRATAGTDEEFEAEIPIGPATGVAKLWGSAPVMKIKSKRTGGAETAQDAIVGASIVGGIVGGLLAAPAAIGALFPAGVAPKVVGPADRIAVPAPPDPVPIP